MQNGRFLSKITIRLKKVCYSVFLCEICQRQSSKAFIGIRAKMIGGGCQGYGEYCIIMGWDAGAAAMRFRGRGQASRVPWLYGTVPYGWAEHTNSVAL